MPRHAERQSPAAPPQEPLRDQHVPHRLRDLIGERVERDVYLSTDEAAQYAGRPSREAFIEWARRHAKKPMAKTNVDNHESAKPCAETAPSQKEE